jgi:hypothetical protein
MFRILDLTNALYITRFAYDKVKKTAKISSTFETEHSAKEYLDYYLVHFPVKQRCKEQFEIIEVPDE